MPVIPSFDLPKSLRFWTEGLGFTMDRDMWQGDKMVGCMVHDDTMYFWLNQRTGGPAPEGFDGIRLYWTPEDLSAAHNRLKDLGFEPSEIEQRDYGQTEFVVTDDDGYTHCFGVQRV
jgi:catechol 2,3-dioxygenase-like lactoylglutathione lyase family enzyme